MTCGVYTLSEATERFCIGQFNDARKGFDNYFVFAKDVWNDILKNTLWAFRQKWLEVHQGSPHPYVIAPDNMEYFFGLFYEYKKRLLPVATSESYSLLPKPTVKKCGCKVECGCSDMCSAASSTRTYTTKEHEIDGETYTEKIWTEICKNGEVKVWREVPTAVYNDEQEIESVEYVSTAETVCTLEVLPCGCISETPANRELLAEYCGCSFEECTGLYKPQPSSRVTTLQFSEGKIFIIGKDVKPWYLIKFRERNASASSLVPENCLFALNLGMDYYSKVINPRFGENAVRAAKYKYKEACQKIVEELNPIDLEFLYKLQSQPFILP